MPRKPNIGRRAVNAAHTPTPNVKFGGSAAKRAVAIDDGEYQLIIEGARAVTSKKTGSTSIVLTAMTKDKQYVLLRPMLVWSPGGDSQLTINNRAILELMIGLEAGEEIDLDTLIKRLTSTRCDAELRLVVDNSGAAINEIADAWLGEEE